MFGDGVAVYWPGISKETRSPGGEVCHFRRNRTIVRRHGASSPRGFRVGPQCLAGPAGLTGATGLAGMCTVVPWVLWVLWAACALWDPCALCDACALWVL